MLDLQQDTGVMRTTSQILAASYLNLSPSLTVLGPDILSWIQRLLMANRLGWVLCLVMRSVTKLCRAKCTSASQHGAFSHEHSSVQLDNLNMWKLKYFQRNFLMHWNEFIPHSSQKRTQSRWWQIKKIRISVKSTLMCGTWLRGFVGEEIYPTLDGTVWHCIVNQGGQKIDWLVAWKLRFLQRMVD